MSLSTSTTEDSPCRGADVRQIYRGSKVLPLMRFGSFEQWCQLRYHPRHLSRIQSYENRVQKPRTTPQLAHHSRLSRYTNMRTLSLDIFNMIQLLYTVDLDWHLDYSLRLVSKNVIHYFSTLTTQIPIKLSIKALRLILTRY
ncbi:hypothetical protein TNCV_426771 [Trichonephila clavipes]|nr:hypothetical protein TNCV_426771 [Trichonephila clavipes]